MFIRKLGTLVAVAALALLALGASSASATTIRFDPGNVAAPTSNITITNTTSAPSTLTTGIGNIRCTTTVFEATVNNNHDTILTGTLNQLTFTNCTDTLPVINISSCHRESSPVGGVSIHATGGGNSSQTLRDVTVRCGIVGGNSACYYTAGSAAGTGVNSTSTLTFPLVNATAVLATPDAFDTGGCGTTGTFSATLLHIVEVGSNRTITIT